jgi:DNA-binding NtrC family response regulator
MQRIAGELRSAIEGTSTILLLGETGTGKTLFAQAIAEASSRRPIVRAVLGASDDLNTITSELFGHERGAFTGAIGKRVGLVERADGGTLILDEVLNLPMHAQQLLLDFTQFGEYRPLGYTRAQPKRARVRIVAATNGDLKAAIGERRFRQDLYFRLASVPIELPPLRARREDVPDLAIHTLRRTDPARAWTLSPALQQLLASRAFEWPGNVRQLERVIERARERAMFLDPNATQLAPDHVDLADARGSGDGEEVLGRDEGLGHLWQHLQADRSALDRRERILLERALETSSGVVSRAARALGLARTTLSSRLDAYGLRTAKTA